MGQQVDPAGVAGRWLGRSKPRRQPQAIQASLQTRARHGSLSQTRHSHGYVAKYRKAGRPQAEMIAMHYIAYLHKTRRSDYGVSFPDFPGCITAGKTLEEARRM